MKEIAFGQFRFDLINECLWQGARAIPLRPKAFAVLRVLLEHPGQLVNKQQILDAVWPGTFVGDAVLKDSIRRLREALNDDAGTPSYIETAHRRGYRFIGQISSTTAVEGSGVFLDAPGGGLGLESTATAAISPMAAATQILGRDAELATVRNWFSRAVSGKRQTVFITGEAGIGKTTLVQAFLEQAVEVPGTVVVRGQCLEHFGSGEAYLPVLDGFSRLCKSSAGNRVLQVLREQAPSWLAHMSFLAPPLEKDILQPQSAAAPRERMLREMAEAIDTLTEKSPLLLVLEDLHWSDYSTLDLISYLARRADPARLMIIGTYRPVDVILASHPLRGVKRELQAHRLCHELPLEYLSEHAIDQYLAVRFTGGRLPGRLRQTIYRRTDGNPLFMVNLVEYLIDHNVIVQEQGSWKLRAECSEAEHGIPSSIKELIEKQIERLSPEERQVLEAASATGMEFSTVAIAAGLDMPREWVDAHCEELARRHQFLFPAGLAELPDGTITPRYKFKHVLYREVPYSLIPAMPRAQIHQRIADRAVVIFRERASEIAAELAMHFEQSRDWQRALQYLIEAARTAARRSAHHEAAELSRRGLEVLKWLPETTERVQQEVTLRMILSVSLLAVHGFAADEMEKIRVLGKVLFKSQGPSAQLFNLLAFLLLYYKYTGQMRSAEENAVQLLQIAETLGDPALVMEAHRSMGSALVEQGKCAEALGHFNQASALYPANHNHPYTLTTVHDCKVVSECFAARSLWAMGESDAALDRMQVALAFAKELSHPASSMFVAHFAAQLHRLRGEILLARDQASEILKMADEYGLDLWQALGNIDMGWAVAELEDRQHGIDQMQRGVEAYMATGAKLWCPYFLGLLADQLGKAGRLEEGLQEISRALCLAGESGELYALAELQRIKERLMTQKDARRVNTPAADSAPKATKASSEQSFEEQSFSEQNLAEPYFAEGISIPKQQRARSREVSARHRGDRFAAKAQN